MKTILIIILSILSFYSYSITYSWNGSVSSDWGTPSNWSPAGVPDVGDEITIEIAPNTCFLDVNRTIDGITINSGTLNLNGLSLLINASNSFFNSGNIVNGTLNYNSPTNNVTFVNTVFDADLNITASRIILNGGEYNNPCLFEQTGNTNTGGAGGATFNNDFTFTLSGNGYFRTNGNNTFNGTTTFINNGGDYILFELNDGSTYSGDLFLINNSNSHIRVAYDGSNFINGNIEMVNVGGGDIRFGEQASASVQLGAGVILSIGMTGFNDGGLRLNRVNQTDVSPQSLLLTGTTTYFRSEECSWMGNVIFTSPRISVNDCVFGADAFLEKTQGNWDQSGGNIFNGNTTIIHSGMNNSFRFGRGAPDIFNGDLIIQNVNGNSSIRMADNSLGNQINGNLTILNNSDNSILFCNENSSDLIINGNIEVNSIASSDQIRFGSDGNPVTLSAGNTISVGMIGYTTGDLYFWNFIQVGATPQVLNLTGNARLFQRDAQWDGDFTGVAPRIYTRETIYNGVVYLEKNGAGNDDSYGGNTFNQVTTIVNSGVNRLRFALTDPDIFNEDLIVQNMGTSDVRIAENSLGNQINGNVFVTNTSDNDIVYFARTTNADLVINGDIQLESDANANGIRFGTDGGIITLLAGNTVSIGPLGFENGDLRFRNFTQVGPTPQNITLTGTARLYNYDSNWGGDFTGVAPRILTRGTTYNGLTYLEKTGALNDASAGGNYFAQDCELRNTGTRYFLMGNGNPDVWDGDLVMNNMGEHYMYIAHNSAGNTIAGDLTINNSGFGAGSNYIYITNNAASTLNIAGDVDITNTSSATNAYIYFANANNSSTEVNGNINATNNSTSNNARLYIGNSGDLNVIGNLTVDNLSTNPTSLVYIGTGGNSAVSVGGDLVMNNNNNANSGQMYLANGGTTSATINGTTTVTNDGANTTKRIYLGNAGSVTFQGDLTVLNNSTATNSQVYLNRGATSNNLYNGNIVVSSSTVDTDGVRFGEVGGSGTLAAGLTVSVLGNNPANFVAGNLTFRNFTQVGPTVHSLILSNTARLYNYDSNWGG